VDNCLGGGQFDAFSRLIGGTDDTIGPFDPVRPGSTFLPDGNLNAGDAPMPAARIDVRLSGTVGALEDADKHVLYSRNRTGVASAAYPGNAHNLYAPFYGAYIPATTAPETSSGTHGAVANNFPGYQGEPGLYHFWDLLNTRSLPGGDNACRDVGGTGQFGDGTFIPRPSGYDRATVYTDEHGEAIVEFNPDVGAILTPNANGLCDLGEINGPALLGSATITADARDPFQLTFVRRPGNTLTKNVYELAGKSLDCVAKSPILAFCVEVIRDIRGNPVAGAEVSFTREPRGLIVPAALNFGGYNTIGQTIVSATDNEVRVRTNALGQAGVEIKSTLPGLVDVDAENYATRNGGFGVQRVRCIRFFGDGAAMPTDGPTCAAPSDSGTPLPVPTPGGGGSSPIGGGGSISAPAPTAVATVVSLAGNPAPAKVNAKAKAKAKVAAKKATKLASARLVFVKGKRYLVVRANGSAKTAKLRITLVMRTGKAAKPVVRTVRTNKAVRVANLLVGKHVRTVRVSLAK
jgi:hypothetical protein